MNEEINLTPEQILALKEQKMKKFKEMGLPAAAGQMNQITELPKTTQQIMQEQKAQERQNNVHVDEANVSDMTMQIRQQIAEITAQRNQIRAHFTNEKLQKIRAIQGGALRQEYQVYNKAGDGSGMNGYQLPEPKVGKRRAGMGMAPSKFAVAPAGAPTKVNHEANMIESMFAGTSSPKFSVASNMNGKLINEEANYGMDFNAKWNEKKAMMGNQPMMPNSTSANAEIQELKEMMKMILQNQMGGQQQIISENSAPKQKTQSPYDMQELKHMMVEIAKKVSSIMIKEVLEEYTKTHTKAQQSKGYKKRGENLIEVDGKLYRAVNG